MASSGTTYDDERALLAGLAASLNQRLPRAWRARLEPVQAPMFAGVRPDAILILDPPDGRPVGIGVETRLNFYPRDVYTMSSQLGGLWPRSPRPAGRLGLQPDIASWLVLSRFLTLRSRELLAEAGFSYADATGNIRIESANPPLFIQLQGADTNPKPADQTLRSLRGSGSSRVVRGLLDFRPPYTLRDLAERAGLPLGTASRTINFLEDEGLVGRDGRGPISEVDWRRLLKRWARDYSLLETNRATFYLEPRGPQALRERLRSLTMSYALTGSLAVPREARVAEAALAAVYVPNAQQAAIELGLRSIEGIGNVLLLEPPGEEPMQRLRDVDGYQCVALSQVVVDLLTSPGRGPVEAEALMEWMTGNEDAWRSG